MSCPSAILELKRTLLTCHSAEQNFAELQFRAFPSSDAITPMPFKLFIFLYTQIKKTVNTENIPGMCVLTNHTRDLVTAENEWVLSHGIELFRKTTSFNLHQSILQKLEVAIP